MRRRIFSIVSVCPRWPCTWAQPVMPGLTLWRRDNGEICSANASLRAIGCGRGPTIDISPSSTFTSWGSSSIFVRLRIRPTRVTRGSFLTACLKWHPSSIVVIDRNLRTLMTSLLYPCRVWRKNTGPRESSLTANETASKSGENTSRASPAMHMSNARFANRSNADSGGGGDPTGGGPPPVWALSARPPPAPPPPHKMTPPAASPQHHPPPPPPPRAPTPPP